MQLYFNFNQTDSQFAIPLLILDISAASHNKILTSYTYPPRYPRLHARRSRDRSQTTDRATLAIRHSDNADVHLYHPIPPSPKMSGLFPLRVNSSHVWLRVFPHTDAPPSWQREHFVSRLPFARRARLNLLPGRAYRFPEFVTRVFVHVNCMRRSCPENEHNFPYTRDRALL